MGRITSLVDVELVLPWFYLLDLLDCYIPSLAYLSAQSVQACHLYSHQWCLFSDASDSCSANIKNVQPTRVLIFYNHVPSSCLLRVFLCIVVSSHPSPLTADHRIELAILNTLAVSVRSSNTRQPLPLHVSLRPQHSLHTSRLSSPWFQHNRPWPWVQQEPVQYCQKRPLKPNQSHTASTSPRTPPLHHSTMALHTSSPTCLLYSLSVQRSTSRTTLPQAQP